MVVCSVDTRVVHVIDDDEDLQRSLAFTLRSLNYDVYTHGTAQDFLRHFDPHTPSCLLVDLLLPGMTGLVLCQKLIEMKANCSFIMLSGHADLSTAVESMKLGAIDFLEKPCSRQSLLDAVHRGCEIAIRRHQDLLEREDALARLKTLSPREQQVFEAMTSGLATKQIAVRLGISPKTVDVHRSKIMQKLRISSATELAYLVSLRLLSER